MPPMCCSTTRTESPARRGRSRGDSDDAVTSSHVTIHAYDVEGDVLVAAVFIWSTPGRRLPRRAAPRPTASRSRSLRGFDAWPAGRRRAIGWRWTLRRTRAPCWGPGDAGGPTRLGVWR